MNYTQQNLPLSPRKVIKKSIRFIFFLIFALIIFGPFLLAYSRMGFLPYVQVITVIFLAVLVAIPVIGIVYEYLYYKLYRYNFTDDSAEIKKGVIAQATGHVRYERLQNIYVDQDFWDRIFGLYDVHYETAGETSRFYSHVDGLSKDRADTLTNFLLEKMKSKGMPPPNNTHSPSQSSPVQSQTNIPEISSSTHPISKKIVYAMTFGMFIIFAVLSLIPLFVLVNGSCSHGQCQEPVPLSTLSPWWIGLWLIILLLSYMYSAAWFRNFRYTLGQNKGEILTKVIGQNVSYVYYDRIQNINVRQGILDRPFGIYSVVIETAGERSGKNLEIPGLSASAAGFIRNFLLEKSKQHRNSL